MIWIAILSLLFILITGYLSINQNLQKHKENHSFVIEYRNRFIDLSNSFTEFKSRFYQTEERINPEEYAWLTRNADKVQSLLGHIGRMHYIAPFRAYEIKNYEIILNTLPKFLERTAESFDINYVYNCLLRFDGIMEIKSISLEKAIKNPFIWFRQGIQNIFDILIYILNWFGILNDNKVTKILTNSIYKFITGIFALVAFVSGIVTIIQGKDITIQFFKQLFQLK